MSRAPDSPIRKDRPTVRLERRLAALNRSRRLLRLISGLSTLAWVASAAAVVLGAVGALIAPKAGIRTGLLGVSAAIVLYVVIRYVLARWLARSTIRGAAVIVEKHFGGFRNNLVSAIDIWRSDVWRHSPAFAAALADVTNEKCKSVRFGKAARKVPTLKAFVMGIIGLGIVAGLLYVWPDEARRQLYTYIEAPRKVWEAWWATDITATFEKDKQLVLRHEPSTVAFTFEGSDYSTYDVKIRKEGTQEWVAHTLQSANDEGTRFEYKVEKTEDSYDCQVDVPNKEPVLASVKVVDRPEIVKMWLEYTFPQYMDLVPVVTRTRDGKIRAIYGTFIRITIEANVELEDSMLNVNGEAALMRINGRYTSGRLRVEQNGKYEIVMKSTDGYKNLPTTFEISAGRDSLPTVRVVNFQTKEVVVEFGDQGAVPVELEARDDEGIRQVDIMYELRQLPEAGFRILEKDGTTGTIFYDPSRQAPHEVIEGFLDELPIEIGDVVTFKIRATDTCTVNDNVPPPEPHVVYSKPYRVVIVSP
ncbi:MAG: hypothetical protein QF662_04545, partial [Phycisphaerae bacterium]|nr:hypothetical protein [Phycisphaerae bacterium]